MQAPITECPACGRYAKVWNQNFKELLEKGRGVFEAHNLVASTPVSEDRLADERCPASGSRVTLTPDELSDFRADHDDERRHEAEFEATCIEDAPDIGPAPWKGEF